MGQEEEERIVIVEHATLGEEHPMGSTTIAIDLAKTVFELAVADAD